jgi:hypothetical protein
MNLFRYKTVIATGIMFLTLFILLGVAIKKSTSYSTVSSDVLTSLKRFAEYSAAAYCPENYVAFPANLSICPGGVCADLQSPYIARAHAFPATAKSQATAILAIDHQERLMIVSFRGTVTDKDWQTNIDFFLTNASDICPNCKAHAGFLDSWRGARKPILDFWKLLRANYPDYKSVVTGHSLGGALATLCSLEMSNLDRNATILLFTYGVPRVGDQTFASYIETTLGQNSYRMTHLNDPVPRLPGRLLGFRHPYPEYHITSPHISNVLSAKESALTSPANLAVTMEDVLVLDRSESDEGVVGYRCSDIAMHDAYFIDISKCVTGDNTPLLGGTYFAID